jgi:hypothetical protein
MEVACENVRGPSILAYEGHGVSDVPIGPYILAYWWHGGRVQESCKSIHPSVWVAWRYTF